MVNARASRGWWTEHSTKSHPAKLPSGEDPLRTPGVNSVVSKAIIVAILKNSHWFFWTHQKSEILQHVFFYRLWPHLIEPQYWHSDLNDQNLFRSTIDALIGVPGVSKNQDDQTEVHTALVSWSAKIQSKLTKLWKTVKIEQKLSKNPCFLKVFWILFNLSRILAHQFFDTPGTPGPLYILPNRQLPVFRKEFPYRTLQRSKCI